jgi:hypothetical protein
MKRQLTVTTFNIYQDQLDRLEVMGLLGKKSEIVRKCLDSVLEPDLPTDVKTNIDAFVAKKDEVMKELLICFGGVTNDFALRFVQMLYRETFILIALPASKKYLEEWVTRLVKKERG